MSPKWRHGSARAQLVQLPPALGVHRDVYKARTCHTPKSHHTRHTCDTHTSHDVPSMAATEPAAEEEERKKKAILRCSLREIGATDAW
jgi:hypothetical protein